MLKGRCGLLAVTVIAAVVSSCSSNPLSTPACTATAGTDHMTLQREQAVNATTIAAVGQQMGVPDHGVTIALATALQESKLRNLTSGDRDSVGLFQQRPSQGWGPRNELLKPRFAATAFYQRLLKVDGWQALAVTDAAQQVQHSAAPNAYASWEPSARILARVLTGEAPAGLTCRTARVGTGVGLAGAAAADLGPGALGTAVAPRRGWLVASWLVARADTYPVSAIGFSGWRWTQPTGRWTADPTAGGAVTVTTGRA